jgi:hypothetical protein
VISCIRICIQVKIQKFYRLKIELWRAVDVHNGGLEVQNGALEVLETNVSRFLSLGRGLGPDPDLY